MHDINLPSEDYHDKENIKDSFEINFETEISKEKIHVSFCRNTHQSL